MFEFSYPESSIIPFFVSEQQAIDTLMSDNTQGIIVTKELTKEQVDYLKSKYKRIARQHCIAVDAVAIITNKENPVTSLSMTEIGDILNGKVTRWSQLVSQDTTAIKIVFDNVGSSTVSYMRDKFLPAGRKIRINSTISSRERIKRVSPPPASNSASFLRNSANSRLTG